MGEIIQNVALKRLTQVFQSASLAPLIMMFSARNNTLIENVMEDGDHRRNGNPSNVCYLQEERVTNVSWPVRRAVSQMRTNSRLWRA